MEESKKDTMNLLDKIEKLAKEVGAAEDYQLLDVLTRIAMDVSLVETQRHFIKQFKIAQTKIAKMKSDLSKAQLYKLSEDLDIIARDLEKQIITFSAEDPIAAVLDSYKILHKVADTSNSSKIQEILAFAEREDLSYAEKIKEIESRVMGLPDQTRENIYYVLDKDHNMQISQYKTARQGFIKNPKTNKERKRNRRLLDRIIEEYSNLPREDQKK